jgi:heme O synthase-like polyprenyltransferase
MVTPNAISYYYGWQSSFKLLSKRGTRSGVWITPVKKKHSHSFKIVFCDSVMILISIVSLPVLTRSSIPLVEVILVGLSSFFLAIAISCLNQSTKHESIEYFSIAVPVYLIEHPRIAGCFMAVLIRKLPKW